MDPAAGGEAMDRTFAGGPPAASSSAESSALVRSSSAKVRLPPPAVAPAIGITLMISPSWPMRSRTVLMVSPWDARSAEGT
jgi:hypothetical protein